MMAPSRELHTDPRAKELLIVVDARLAAPEVTPCAFR